MSPVPASPKISVLLPCYQQEAFVREAVESVLGQNFDDWEIVASDDASPDDTHAVLQDVAARDGRVRIFRQKKNLGMVANWNFCLRQARGEAVKLMGGDDRLESKDCLIRQWQALQAPGVVLVASARRILDENSRITATVVGLRSGIFPAQEIVPKVLEHADNLIGEPVCCLFRRADARWEGLGRFRVSMDVWMWIDLLGKSGRLAYEVEPLAAFRRHAGQNCSLVWHQDQGAEHLGLILEKARDSIVPGKTKLKVFFRARDWCNCQPDHPAAASIQSLAQDLAKSFSPWELTTASIQRAVTLTLARWGRSLRKRVPLNQR